MKNILLIDELLRAVINNDSSLVRKRLEEGIDPNIVVNSIGYTPLHLAAINNSYESALILIGAGATLNLKTINGDTPLKLAVLHENSLMIRLLTNTEKHEKKIS